jgi:DNA-binding NarL/FixJ family response regulator
MVRVLIADDHAVVRAGLRWALEHAGCLVVGEAGDGAEAIDKAVMLRPDVVLMDLSLPIVSGADATERITALVPETSVLVLSMLADDATVVSVLRAGARGYLVKDCSTAEIVDGVQRVATGDRVLASSVSGRLCQSAATGTPPAHVVTQPSISKREEEVLRLMAAGASTSEVARRLYISVKTVKNHLSSIYDKLDSHDRTQAVLKALRLGLIELD